MSSLDNIYQKMVPTLESATLAQLHHEPTPPPDQPNHIGREVAHDLNNILTIIQGYAERMMVKNGENPVLRRDLQTITDNARRAVSLIKQARKPSPAPALA